MEIDISKELDALKALEIRLEELRKQDVDYNSKEIKKYYKELKKIELFVSLIQEIKKLHRECFDLQDLMTNVKNDEEIYNLASIEYEQKIIQIKERKENLYSNVMSENEENADEIIVEIRAGTGGDEASLFVADLLKAYCRFCENNNIAFEIVEMSKNELNGIKSCSITFKGKDVLKIFSFESGVHRVQRIPLTEANGRIHTSAVTVAVLPCEEEVEVQINMDEIDIKTCRASGAGGQHVNKTDSAVRLTHMPTGIVIECQEERSQIKNREKAMKILKLKLYELEKQKHQEDRNKKREVIGSGDRSEKSRTYNYPQNRITDHCYNVTIYQLDHIMNGNLNIFLEKLEEEKKKAQLEKIVNTKLIDLIMN